MLNSKNSQLPPQPNLPELEQEVLEKWHSNKTFEQSVLSKPEKNSYVFYDGPPFATGMPHYGHLLASTIKDVIPRYWAMKNYQVNRRWGWDCHGLPIENMIEQKLEIKGGKKGIEELGIAQFNEACRSEVLRLDTEWEKIINRLGRWVDFEHNYKTMDTSFMESVWWGFSELYKKDLVYQGKKVVLYCPRCATPLSNFEIAMDNSYKDVVDHSVFIKFQAAPITTVSDTKTPDPQSPDPLPEFFLAWTTTPWTLPGNVALAVQPEALYSQVKTKTELLWVAENLREQVLQDTIYEVVQTVPGTELIGRSYTPLFSYFDHSPESSKQKNQLNNAWKIVPAEFVSLEDGTGIVHTAAVFGEDDYALALELDLPTLTTVDDQGKFLPFITLVAGQFYKKGEEPILAQLSQQNLVYRAEKITHSYPFCWRCATPLFYNAVPAWFINIQKLKPDLLAQNEKINWYPAHLKHGRFGKGLETAPDWNISRSRYWGTPMPIWTDVEGTHTRIISSIAELQEWAVDQEKAATITDIHREHLDDLELWLDDKHSIKGKRIPEVFDCWVESGSMPFAAEHYPFENKKQFEQNYPAQFVSEYIAQTRAWFYTMHVLSVGIFGTPPFENVLATGTVLAEDGSKMSKSKKNYPDPMLIINEYGSDSLRLYLMSSPIMKGENLNFVEKDVADIRKKVFLIWWNMISFYSLYAENHTIPEKAPNSPDVMDQWILSKLASTVQSCTEYFDQYDVVKASRALMELLNELSTWYLRRSRDRLRSPEHVHSLDTFGYVLVTLAKLYAPLTPFFAEWSYSFLRKTPNSVHLEAWPTLPKALSNPSLEESMVVLRQAVEQTHAERNLKNIKVRQPLASVVVTAPIPTPSAELLVVLADEVNVKEVIWQQGTEGVTIVLDTQISSTLAAEGEARELMRNIQKLRKKAGLTVGDHSTVATPSWSQEWQEEIQRRTNTTLIVGPSTQIIE
jgi:isoleucyl-tRNA synthetase